MFPGYELIFLVLVPASLFDLWRYRVPNALYAAALTISLIRHLETQGLAGVPLWFAGIFIPFILCYFFCRCHMLGAADSKLFSVVGSLLGVRMTLRIMLISLLIGAVMSLVKMIWHRNGWKRFSYFFRYVAESLRDGQIKPYYDKKRDGEEGIIPFTVAISLAVIFCVSM